MYILDRLMPDQQTGDGLFSRLKTSWCHTGKPLKLPDKMGLVEIAAVIADRSQGLKPVHKADRLVKADDAVVLFGAIAN